MSGYLIVVVAVLMIALSPLGSEYLMRYNNTLSSTMYWSLATAVYAFILVFLRKEQHKVVDQFRKNWRVLAAVGVLSSFGVLGWFHSISAIGPSLSSFLGRIGTLFLVIVSIAVLKESFNLIEVIGAAITLLGVFMITFSPVDYLGWKIIYIVFGSCSYAIGQLIAKKHIAKITPTVLTLATASIVFLCVTIFTVLTGSFELYNPASLPVLLTVPLLSETLGIYLMYVSYQKIGVGKAQIVRSGFPFVVVIYLFILGRGLPLPHQILGGTMIISGVVILMSAKHIFAKRLMKKPVPDLSEVE